MSALMSDDFILDAEQYDEFKMWQGLVGPYYYPSVDEAGNLSWTNNGGLSNPAVVNIQGRGLTIVGIVEDVSDLPVTADPYVTYLVGTASPYDGYIYDNGTWVNLGAIGVAAGFGTPTATVDSGTGTPSVTITASGPDTAKVFAFAFSNLKGEPGQDGVGIPASGSSGQVLIKNSSTDYDCSWANPGGVDPATATPLADGTAAVGSSEKYAREDHVHPINVATSGTPAMDGTAALGSASTYARSDHVHPTDTSRQETLVSGTNIKTINNNSLLGSGDITISGGGALYFTSVAVSATTGDIATVSDANITADHVVAEVTWANPSAITTDVTWTTASGSLVLNGTCTAATTANIVLVKKNN